MNFPAKPSLLKSHILSADVLCDRLLESTWSSSSGRQRAAGQRTNPLQTFRLEQSKFRFTWTAWHDCHISPALQCLPPNSMCIDLCMRGTSCVLF